MPDKLVGVPGEAVPMDLVDPLGQNFHFGCNFGGLAIHQAGWTHGFASRPYGRFAIFDLLGRALRIEIRLFLPKIL